MQSHGMDLMRLTMSVVLLEYDEVRAVAENIVGTHNLTPAVNADGSANASLPPRFYDLQRHLRTRAQTIADAAARRNDADMSAALSHLTETCIACHSVYLNGPEGPPSSAR